MNWSRIRFKLKGLALLGALVALTGSFAPTGGYRYIASQPGVAPTVVEPISDEADEKDCKTALLHCGKNDIKDEDH